MRSFGIVKLNIGSDTCLKFARTHLFCQHPTEDLYILDILSETLRVSGDLGLLFFKFCSFFESYFWQFLLSEWIRTYD